MNPEWHGKATLVQLTPKSWSDIKQYSEIESEVAGLIGKINGQFGDAAWTPIRYRQSVLFADSARRDLSRRRRRDDHPIA